MTIEKSFFTAVEEKAEQPKPEEPRKTETGFTVTEEGVETITFRGQALEDIKKLQSYLRRAEKPGDVIRTALELLALAVHKDVTIEGGGKKWRITDLWKTQ